MKTEEYIETIVSAHANMRWMDASELRTILTSVMDMARKEEKSMIMGAFQKALDECSHGLAIECSKVDLIMKFFNNLE